MELLLPQAPRPINRALMAKRRRVLLVGLVLAAGLALLLAGYGLYEGQAVLDERSLYERGRPVERVTRVEADVKTHTYQGLIFLYEEHDLALEYVDEGGIERLGRTYFTLMFSGVGEGVTYAARYDPVDPTRISVDLAYERPWARTGLALIALSMGALMLLLLGGGARSYFRSKSAVENCARLGEELRGDLVDMNEAKGHYFVSFHLRDGRPARKALHATLQAPPLLVAGPEGAEQLVVVRSRQDPTRFVVVEEDFYPFLGVSGEGVA